MDKIIFLLFSILLIGLASCENGYKKVDDSWTWISSNEGGTQSIKINADVATFEILENKEYAKDKNNVYWKGMTVDQANPSSFKIISKNYSKDAQHVFLGLDIVMFANPSEFQLLEWPFSRDDKFVFNGNIPITNRDIEQFKVTKSTESMTYLSKSFFMRLNEDYQWLDSLNVEGISISQDSEGQTNKEKFRGIKKFSKNKTL